MYKDIKTCKLLFWWRNQKLNVSKNRRDKSSQPYMMICDNYQTTIYSHLYIPTIWETVVGLDNSEMDISS
jgi:hypothetical protein